MRVCVQFPEPMGKKLGTVDVLIILGLGKQRQIDPGYTGYQRQITERLFQEGKKSGCCLRNNIQGCSLIAGYLHLSLNTYSQEENASPLNSHEIVQDTSKLRTDPRFQPRSDSKIPVFLNKDLVWSACQNQKNDFKNLWKDHGHGSAH